MMTHLVDVMRRLTSLLDEETAALRDGNHALLGDFRDRKGHGLLELSRAVSGLRHGEIADVRIEPTIKELRSRLETNLDVVKLHLDAMNELTEVIANAIRESEWDGTYSQTNGRYSSAL